MPSKRAIILMFALIFAAGLIEAALECRRMYLNERGRLITGALHNANAFPAQELASLAGIPADAETHQYKRLRDNLDAARASHPAIGYVSILRYYPDDGRVVSLGASGMESEAARVPGAGAPRDGTPDAKAARELASGATDVAVRLFHRDWQNKYWNSGYARCNGSSGPVANDAPALDIYRYDIDANYWLVHIGKNALAHLISVWLLLGLPFAAYLLGKRHKLRAMHILHLDEAIEQADTPIMIVRMDNSIKYVNRALCKQVGYTSDELRGRQWGVLRHPEPASEVVAQRSAMIREGIAVEAEWDFRRKDGTGFPVRITATPVHDTTGKVTEIIFVISDITEHRRRALLLKKEKEKAEQEDYTKALLIAATNDEVRAPLAEIDRLTRELVSTPLAPEQAGYAATVRKSSLSLSKLTRNIIDFSQIESGRMRVNPVSTDLRALVCEILDMFRTHAAERGINLAHEVAADVPASVIVAADSLRQILLNLVDNAIKFTQTGEIKIRLKVLLLGDSHPADAPPAPMAKDKSRLTLLFSVSDTGIGINPGEQEKLFRPFWQADSGNTRRHGGAGLGLPISRELVQLLGGDISIESIPGAGTTFHFSVVCTLQHEEAANTVQ